MHRGEEVLLTQHFSLKLFAIFVVGLSACNNEAVAAGSVTIGNANASKTIVIGYLTDQLAPPYRIGALQMAIEDGQANGLLPDYNFRCATIVSPYLPK
jgi:hypothetical protein